MSVNGASGELADGLVRAASMSLMLAGMRSLLELAKVILTLVGNQERVSQIRKARDSQSQTLKQRYDSRAGPMYHPSAACGDEVVRSSGFS